MLHFVNPNVFKCLLKKANVKKLFLKTFLNLSKKAVHKSRLLLLLLVRLVNQNVKIVGGALSVFLFMGTATAHDQNEAIRQYIKILDLELFSRHAKYTAPKLPIPKVKPSRIPIPRYKPTHSLTSYRDLYVYVTQPHNYISKRTIKCYSVGVDKYGWIVKIPCKETKVKKQSQ